VSALTVSTLTLSTKVVSPFTQQAVESVFGASSVATEVEQEAKDKLRAEIKNSFFIFFVLSVIYLYF
jgi:hypothetical protein